MQTCILTVGLTIAMALKIPIRRSLPGRYQIQLVPTVILEGSIPGRSGTRRVLVLAGSAIKKQNGNFTYINRKHLVGTRVRGD